MYIGGLQKFTLIDYPGKIAAVVFTTGCNFRCPFCHNPEIVNPKLIDYKKNIKEKEILKFLKSRIGDLDGICITGGEPTLQFGLVDFISKVKDMRFLVKLDTNASHYQVVKNLIKRKLVDYWAIDVKTMPVKYKVLTKKENVLENIENSIDLITNSKASLELRTTVVRGVVNTEDFDGIINWINGINRKTFSKLYRYSIQNFRPEKTLHDGFSKVVPYKPEEMELMAEKLRKYCKNVVIF